MITSDNLFFTALKEWDKILVQNFITERQVGIRFGDCLQPRTKEFSTRTSKDCKIMWKKSGMIPEENAMIEIAEGKGKTRGEKTLPRDSKYKSQHHKCHICETCSIAVYLEKKEGRRRWLWQSRYKQSRQRLRSGIVALGDSLHTPACKH